MNEVIGNNPIFSSYLLCATVCGDGDRGHEIPLAEA